MVQYTSNCAFTFGILYIILITISQGDYCRAGQAAKEGVQNDHRVLALMRKGHKVLENLGLEWL